MSTEAIAAQISEIAQRYLGRRRIVDRDRLIIGELGITGFDFIEFLEEVEAAFGVHLSTIAPDHWEPDPPRDTSVNGLAAIIVAARDGGTSTDA